MRSHGAMRGKGCGRAGVAAAAFAAIVLATAPAPAAEAAAPMPIDAYQVAMGRYEMVPAGPAGDLAPRPFVPVEQRYVWTWANADGRVQRLEYGLFRVSGRDCLKHFCLDIACHAATWPDFTCSDGSTRVMAAPDAGTMILGGITYHRLGTIPGVGTRTDRP